MGRDIMMGGWDNLWQDRPVEITVSLNKQAREAFRILGEWVTEEDKLILEPGSGSGRFCIALAQKFPAAKIMGMDLSLSACLLASKGKNHLGLNNVSFSNGNIFNTPFPDHTFDVVFNEGVVEHFPNYGDAIREMIRVTKPGGKVIIAVPNWWCLPHTLYKLKMGEKYEHGYEKSFRVPELKSLFRELELEVIGIDGFDPVYSIRRLRDRIAGGRYSKLLRRISSILDRWLVGPLDKGFGNFFSRTFGIEIIIMGEKPDSQTTNENISLL